MKKDDIYLLLTAIIGAIVSYLLLRYLGQSFFIIAIALTVLSLLSRKPSLRERLKKLRDGKQ